MCFTHLVAGRSVDFHSMMDLVLSMELELNCECTPEFSIFSAYEDKQLYSPLP